MEAYQGHVSQAKLTMDTRSGSLYTYRCDAHFAEVLSKLEVLRTRQDLCDITMVIEGREFHAHKLILVSCSPYFEAMFLSGMAESRQKSVRLQGIDPSAFESILELFYTGKVSISMENVQSILSAASIFQVEHLIDACSEFLKRHLSPSNCLGVRIFGEAHGCLKLVEHAVKHTISRFNEVVKCEEFLLLNVEQVVELLSRDDLRVHSEEEVFDAAIAWLGHDATERSCQVARLLHQVRLPLLPPAVLADKVKTNRLIQSNLECRDLLDEALISYHLLPERRESIPAQRTRVRKCTLDTGIIYTVGGLNSVGGTLSSVEKFDTSKARWEVSKPMHTLRSRVGVVVVDEKLYAFGGYDGSSRLCTVECYIPQTDEWTIQSPMTTKRSAMSIAVLGKEIYVIGGYDGSSSLASVEVYDTSGDQWRLATSMHTCRSAGGAAVLEGHIYVVGGHDGLSIFNTVERYDYKQSNWTMVTPMHTRRCRLGVAAAAGKLFSIGGYDGQSFLNIVESYDPTINQWTSLSPMTCRRSRVGVAAVSSQIFAIGGYDGLANLSSVEVYDHEKDKWSTGPAMTQHQGGVGVAVILLN